MVTDSGTTKKQPGETAPVEDSVPRREPYHLRTLARGAAVLDLLAENDYLVLKDVSVALELDTSTVYRILRTWTAVGYLEYDSESKRYYAGIDLMRLANKARNSSGLPDIETRLQQLNREVEQTVSFSVLAGRFVLYIARVVANKALTYQVEIGKTLPAYATSAGHVLLAHRPVEEVKALYTEPNLLGFTETTVTTRDGLLESLSLVREQGYAINRGQLGASVTALAVPAKDRDGQVVGAFSMAGPADQFSNDDIYRRYLPALLEAAREPVEARGP